MKKTAILVAVALVGAMAAQPAMAGVGGCRIPGVGGCEPGGWQLSTNSPTTETPSLLESLDGALPAPMAAFLRAMFRPEVSQKDAKIEDGGTLTDAGVGGCSPRPGVGGCWL